MTALISTGPVPCSVVRANSSRSLITVLARSLSCLINWTDSRWSSPSSSSSRICAKAEMPVSGLLISWATPATSSPKATIFSVCRSCSSSRRSWLTLRMLTTWPSSSPSCPARGLIVTAAGNSPPSRRQCTSCERRTPASSTPSASRMPRRESCPTTSCSNCISMSSTCDHPYSRAAAGLA